jgi:eukaryotic-like serine/threonine-protein kinase
MIGKTISHYRIIEELGRGGMGLVYKAQDTKLNRTVALKFLTPELTHNQESKERFIREAHAASALENDNICNIHEIDETDDGQLFIVMACYEGQTLKEKMKDKRLKTKDAIDIVVQIAQGLQKAHHKGIVHRDIKPANIFITDDGSAKILDFGLAKLAGQAQLTKDSSTLGTVAYMSPEQLSGEEVDYRTDIWSLGIVLYEMLNGELPFKGEYEQAVSYSILNDEPKTIKNIDPNIEKIIGICLNKDAKDRYQNIDELNEDLSKLKNNFDIVSEKYNFKVQNRYKSFIFPAALFIFLIFIITGYFIFYQPDIFESTNTTQPEWENSIAVLPFVDMSPTKDQEYFCDGLSEEIINKLSSVKSLKVIARTSSFQFKDKLIDAIEIGKKLNVTNILEGSVRKSNNMVRITAQLINTEDGSHLWSKTYDKEMKNIFSIQDEIAISILDKIQIGMSGEDNLIRVGTNNIDAYEAYLQGQFFFQKFTPDDQQKAIEYYNKAIEIDPLFAKAYAGLADVYNNLSMSGINTPLENIPKAQKLVSKALELDPNLSEAYMIIADIKNAYERDNKEAEELYKKSIQLNPGSATAHSYFGVFLMSLTRYDEALVEVKKSLKLDPLSFALNMNGSYLSLIAKDEELKKQTIQKLLVLNPDSSSVRLFLATDYFYQEKYDDVLRILSGNTDQGLEDGVSTFLACTYARLGNREKAREILNNLLLQRKNRYIDPFRIATIYAVLEDKDKAFEWLNKSTNEFSPRISYIQCFPEFEPIRNDRRYIELLKKLGLKK